MGKKGISRSKTSGPDHWAKVGLGWNFIADGQEEIIPVGVFASVFYFDKEMERLAEKQATGTLQRMAICRF